MVSLTLIVIPVAEAQLFSCAYRVIQLEGGELPHTRWHGADPKFPEHTSIDLTLSLGLGNVTGNTPKHQHCTPQVVLLLSTGVHRLARKSLNLLMNAVAALALGRSGFSGVMSYAVAIPLSSGAAGTSTRWLSLGTMMGRP